MSHIDEMKYALERINHLATVELNGTTVPYYVTNRGDIAAESRKAITSLPSTDWWHDQYIALSKTICEAAGTPTDTTDAKYVGTDELLRRFKNIRAVTEAISKFWGDDLQCDAAIHPGAYILGDEPIRDVVRRAVGWSVHVTCDGGSLPEEHTEPDDDDESNRMDGGKP